MLVACALQDTKRCFGVSTHSNLPLTRADLLHVLASYGPTPLHDDLLFATQLFTGTNCLMRLAELTWPNTLALQDYHKSACDTPLSNYLRPLVSGNLATRPINSLKATTFTYTNPPLKHTGCLDCTCRPVTNCFMADQNCGYT